MKLFFRLSIQEVQQQTPNNNITPTTPNLTKRYNIKCLILSKYIYGDFVIITNFNSRSSNLQSKGFQNSEDTTGQIISQINTTTTPLQSTPIQLTSTPFVASNSNISYEMSPIGLSTPQPRKKMSVIYPI